MFEVSLWKTEGCDLWTWHFIENQQYEILPRLGDRIQVSDAEDGSPRYLISQSVIVPTLGGQFKILTRSEDSPPQFRGR